MSIAREAFQKTEVLELVPSITYNQLDYWAKTGLVQPSIQKASGYGSRRIYSWLDLVALQTVADLLEAGASVQRIRRAIDALRAHGAQHPLVHHLLMVSASGEIHRVVERGKVGQMLTEHPGQTFWLSPVGDFAQEIQERVGQKELKKSTSVMV